MRSYLNGESMVESDDSYGSDQSATPQATVRQATLLDILWRRQGTVILTVVFCLVGAGVYLIEATRIFTGTSRICIQHNVPRLLSTDQQQQGPNDADQYLYTQAETISSLQILSAALDAPGISDAVVFKDVDNKLVYFKKYLDVEVGKKDAIIDVSFNSPDPVEAAAIVNAVVENYVDYEAKQNKSTAGEALKILTAEKDKEELIMEKQEQDLVAFKEKNGDVFFQTDKGNIVMQDLETVSDALAEAKLASSKAEADYQSANNKTTTYTAWVDAEQRVQRMQKVYDEHETAAMALNAKMAVYTKLQDDLARTNKVLDLLDGRMKELDVTQSAGPLNISILEVARPMDKPAYPRRLLTLAGAFALGLFLGMGAALLHEHLDQRLRSAEEVTERFGLPVLGVVPSVKEVEGGSAGRQVHLDPSSDVAEAYRSLRTALHFGLPDQSARTILITSPSPGDGKSTSASNLAVALAQANRRTLIIDADLRKPTQHKVFEVKGKKIGLSDALLRDLPIEQVIQRTQIEGLDILPCGTIPANPAEILNSPAFTDLLSQLSDKYDQIIVDSPPVLPVADARILGALCDVTLLVLRADKSTRKGLAHAREHLSRVRARLIGTIVNDVARRDKGYGYSYYYGGYGEKSQGSTPRSSRSRKDNSPVFTESTNGHEEDDFEADFAVRGNGSRSNS